MKCPECDQGKPWNCTGWAIDEDDNMTDCETTNHNEQER